MKHATLILTDPKSQKPTAYRLDLESAQPGVIPKDLSGPFEYRFELDVGNGPVRFSGQVVMSDTAIQFVTTEYPVLVKTRRQWTTCGDLTLACEMADTNATPAIYKLQARMYGKSHFWVDINEGKVTAGTYNADKNTAHSLPFWNFYNHGDVCLGGLDGKLHGQNPLANLNRFLCAYTTPHITQADRSIEFKLNPETGIITANKVPVCDRIDWPIEQRLFQKPLAKITP